MNAKTDAPTGGLNTRSSRLKTIILKITITNSKTKILGKGYRNNASRVIS
jgi:hypothetical protein